MTHRFSIILASFIFSHIAIAQSTTTANDCAAKAISKTGKPLSGAAKAAFIKKCADNNSNSASEKQGKHHNRTKWSAATKKPKEKQATSAKSS
jgi:hypothetical protein